MDFIYYVDNVIKRRDVSPRDKVIFMVIAQCEEDLNDDPHFKDGVEFSNAELSYFMGLSPYQIKQGLASLEKKNLLKRTFLSNGKRLLSVKELHNERALIDLFNHG